MEFEVTRDGIEIKGIIEGKTDGSCPAVIICHGFNGNYGYTADDIFSVISKRLNAIGITAVRFDFDGHGRSGGSFRDMTLFGELLDAFAVLDYVRGLGFSEIYMLGHSQGSVVAGMTAGYYADIVKKLVLLAPAASLKDDALAGRCFTTRYDTNNIPDMLDICGTNGLKGRFFRIAKYMPIYEVTGQFKGSVLAAYGAKDAVISRKSANEYKRVLSDLTVKVYDELDHGLSGKDRENMLDDVAGFLAIGGKNEKRTS